MSASLDTGIRSLPPGFQKSTFDQAFSAGTKHNPLTLMASFAVQGTELSSVSKTFRQANHGSMEQAGRAISLTGRAVATENASEELFGEFPDYPAIAQQLSGEIQALIQGAEPSLTSRQKATLKYTWRKITDFAQLPQQADFMPRCCIHLHRLKTQLTALRDAIALPVAIPGGPAEQAAHQQLVNQQFDPALETAKKFLINESLARRFRGLIFGNPAEKFSVLHHEHLQLAQVSAGTRAQFVENTNAYVHSYAPERFMRAEEIAIEAQLKNDVALQCLWDGVLEYFQQNPPNPLPTTLEEIRAWLNNPANAQVLTEVYGINLDADVIPPEIGRLSALKWLNVKGTVTSLPAELGQLPHLMILNLHHTRFTEFPAVITQMPWLGLFSMMDAQNTYTTISDAAWRHVARGWGVQGAMFVSDAVIGSIIFMGGAQALQNISQAAGHPLPTNPSLTNVIGKNYAELTEVPFGLWFQQHFTVSPPFFLFLIPVFLGYYPSTIVPFAAPLFAVLAIIVTTLISLPFLLYNMFMIKVVEPIISKIMDLCGCDPMMHIGQPEAE